MSELKLEKRHVGRPRKQTLVGTLQEFCSCTHMKILHTDTVQENHGFCIVRDCRCGKFTWVREAVASSEILNPQVNHSVKRFPDSLLTTKNEWKKINEAVEDYDLRKKNPFPRIPHDQKKNVKLTLVDIKQAHVFRFVMGYTIKETAIALDVSTYCIRYHTQLGYKEKENKRRSEKYTLLQKTSPEFLKKHRLIDNNYHHNRRLHNDFLKWEKNSATRYKKMNPQKVLEAHRRWCAKNHDKEMIRWKRYRDKKRAMKNFRLFQEKLN
jgi:hypothetical protein